MAFATSGTTHSSTKIDDVSIASISTDLVAYVLNCVTPVRARWLTFIAMMRTSRQMHDGAITWLRSLRECRSSSMPFPVSKIASIVNTGSLCRMTFDDENDNAIVTLTSHCPALEKIEMHFVDFTITDRTLEALGRKHTHHTNKRTTTSALTHVSLGGDRARRQSGHACSVTDAGIVALCRGCPRLTHLNLSLSWTSVVTDASIVHLVSLCPMLEHLTLKSSDLTDAGVEALAPLHYLQHLDLELSRFVTASTVHRCIHLESLVLRDCHNVSDHALELVARHCCQLRHVDLAMCRKISDDAVIALAHHCPQLKHVDLAYCIFISDDGIGVLVAQCDHLQHVNITACYGVSNMGRVLIESKGILCTYNSHDVPYSLTSTLVMPVM